MTASRLVVCTALFGLLSPAAAFAAPAYVLTTVNLRSAAGTANPVMTKIPGGSLVDAANCTDWCEVSWQGMRGFAIATAIDRSGRVPQRRAAGPPGTVVASGEYMMAAPPPAVVVAPVPYYRPYYYGYGPRWGYRGYYGGYGYRRWRY